MKKFIGFNNVKKVVMAKGLCFGKPIHYVLTTDNKLYQVLTTDDEKTLNEDILNEGIYVNALDVSGLYIHHTFSKLPVYRVLNGKFNHKNVCNFIKENYVIYD